jgi:hypothetical protein
VRLANLDRFEAALDEWFGRRAIPIWLTEYAHETKPGERRGVEPDVQAQFAREALGAVTADRRVRMFIWFVFRDDKSNPWQSGLLGADSRAKPAFASFGPAAKSLDARLAVRHEGGEEAIVRVAALELAYYSGVGAQVSVTARLRGAGVNLVRHPRARLGRDGWLTFRLPVEPVAGAAYTLEIQATDRHGHRVVRHATVRGVG